MELLLQSQHTLAAFDLHQTLPADLPTPSPQTNLVALQVNVGRNLLIVKAIESLQNDLASLCKTIRRAA